MPKASDVKTSTTAQKSTLSKTTGQKIRSKKDRLDILLVLDWEHLQEVGVERTLGGLHRLLGIDKSKLHLLHLEQQTHDKAPMFEPEAMLNRIRANLEKYDFQIADSRISALSSEMVSDLLSEIEKSEYDLLVLCVPELPHSEHSAYKHFVQHVTSHTRISVLVWRKPLSEQPHPLKVLFAVDGSESSLNATSKAVELLRLQYAHLQAVTVLSPLYLDNAVTAPYINPEILEKALKANAQIIFDMTLGILEAQGLPKPSCHHLVGSPATEIGYFAETENPDVMVVGSHNRKGFLAWLMGSVSSQLLQWDTHNLLVVR